MMLARKWDRIENLVKQHGYDIFETIQSDSSDTGVLDDIRDLRCYLLLVEAEMKTQLGEVHKVDLTQMLKAQSQSRQGWYSGQFEV